MLEFPVGEAKLFEFIMKNLKYPQQAKEANIRGKPVDCRATPPPSVMRNRHEWIFGSVQMGT